MLDFATDPLPSAATKARGAEVRQKIHWSPQPGKLACRRKISATSSYRGALSSREFVAKHEESPDMYCSGCAVVAAEWRGGVTFALDECAHLRALVAYLSQGFVGPEARKGLDVLKGKVGP